MSVLVGFMMAIGLAGASAYRAFFPLLVVALIARYTPLTLPPDFTWLSSTWGLLLLLIFVVFEFMLDEFPGVGFFHSSMYWGVKILMGGVLFSTAVQIDFLLSLIFGGLVTGVLIFSRVALERWLQTERPYFRRLDYDEIENLGSIVLTILAIIAPGLSLLVFGVLLYSTIKTAWVV